MQASSSGNYIAEEAFKNSFVQQSRSDVEKAKGIYAQLLKKEGEIFNRIVDEVKNSPIYTDENKAKKAIENFKNKWKKYCLENNIH